MYKRQVVDMAYEKIIMEDNLGNYYDGKTDKKDLNGYHINGNLSLIHI